MRRLTLAFFLLSAFILRPAADAQETDLAFQDLVEVSEILLDVLVTDKEGNVVTGLGAEDFLVKENGEPVTVTGASFYTTSYAVRERLETGEGAAKEIPWSRFFIVFIHDQRRIGTVGNRLLQQQIEAGRELKSWIEEGMLPSDWMAVVSWDVRLHIHQDFTQDREALGRAVEQATLGRIPPAATPSERNRAVAAGPSLYRSLPPADEIERQSKRIYGALRLIAEAGGHLVGRKNLLLFTIGFGEVAGNTFHSRPDPVFYPPLERALNQHNVAVYPIDLTPPMVEHLQSGVLTQMAADTGGYYHHGFLDFRVPLRKISQENVGYYLLSYQTEHPAGESGYRRVVVKTQDKKLRVRTRRGYSFGSGD